VKATIKPGCGYWDVTVYPMGGCFRRAQAPIELDQVEVVDRYKGGAPKTLRGTAGKVRIAVDAQVCELDQPAEQPAGGAR
jgi:hypothetical protein